MSNLSYVNDKLREAFQSINAGKYDLTVDYCFKCVDVAVTDKFSELFARLPLKTQQEILDELKNKYDNKKFVDLTLGPKLHIFKKFDLRPIKSSFDKETNIDRLMGVLHLRNESTHPAAGLDKGTVISLGDAASVYGICTRFLEKLDAEYIENLQKEHSEILQGTVFSVRSNLPPSNCSEFIGREHQMEEVSKLLLNIHKFPVVSIDGIGGVGKSTLALEVSHKLAADRKFDAVIWVSAKKEELGYAGCKKIQNIFTNLEDLFNEVLKVYDSGEFLNYNFETKKKKVLDILTDNRCLLVLDNLETVDDPKLREFIVSSELPYQAKVLITSRTRLGEVEKVLQLKEFTLGETKQYLTSQLRQRNVESRLDDLRIKELHEKTGGIPLGLKMIIPWVVEGKLTDKVINEIDTKIGILDFCFEKVFNDFLTENAKKIFCVLALAPNELSEAALKFISGFRDEEFSNCLFSLEHYSLLVKSNSLEGDEFYDMLPLTRAYGVKKAAISYPTLKKDISTLYLKFLDLSKSEKYSAKTAMAINKAEEAQRLAAQGQTNLARPLFEEALNYDPYCDWALYLYAIFCKEGQNYKEAESFILRAIDKQPTNPRYYVEYSYVLELWAFFKRAEEMLETAKIKTNNDLLVIQRLVVIKERLHKNDEAIKIAKESIIKNPTTLKERAINSLFLVGIMEGYWRLGCKSQDSRQDAEALTRFKEGLIALNTYRSIVDFANKKIEREEKKLAQAIAEIYELQEEYEDAIKYYKISIYSQAFYADRQNHNKYIESRIRTLERYRNMRKKH